MKKLFIITGIISILLSILTPAIIFGQGTQPETYRDIDNPFYFGIRTRTGQEGGLPLIRQCFLPPRGGVRDRDVGTCVMWLLDKILRVIYTIALFLGIIYLIYAGILYITQPGGAAQTHKQITYGITGVVVAIIAFSLVKAIEISLTGGQFAVSPPTPTPAPAPQPSPAPAPGQSRLSVSNVRAEADYATFTGKVDRGSCSIPVEVENTSRVLPNSSGGAENFTINPRVVRVSLPSGTQPNDNLVLIFKTTGQCNVPGLISFKAGGGLPRLSISNVNADISKLTFTGSVNQGECAVLMQVINTTQGTSEPYEKDFFDIAKIYSLPLPAGTKANDRLTLAFGRTDQCQVPSSISLTAGGGFVGQVRPIINIGAPVLVGQQRLVIALPENLGAALIEIFDIAFRQSRLYDPPFYLIVSYSVASEKPTQAVSCSLDVLVTGARVESFTSQPVIATRIKEFNQPFRLPIQIESGRVNYTKSIPLGLSNQIIDRVRITALDLRGCWYQSVDNNIAGKWWRSLVQITAR